MRHRSPHHSVIVAACVFLVWALALLVTNFADPLTFAWPNHAKIFFNNKGVVAKETEHCAQYPPGDMSVWDW